MSLQTVLSLEPAFADGTRILGLDVNPLMLRPKNAGLESLIATWMGTSIWPIVGMGYHVRHESLLPRESPAATWMRAYKHIVAMCLHMF